MIPIPEPPTLTLREYHPPTHILLQIRNRTLACNPTICSLSTQCKHGPDTCVPTSLTVMFLCTLQSGT